MSSPLGSTSKAIGRDLLSYDSLPGGLRSMRRAGGCLDGSVDQARCGPSAAAAQGGFYGAPPRRREGILSLPRSAQVHSHALFDRLEHADVPDCPRVDRQRVGVEGITMSASLPACSVPLRSSSPYWYAASMVIARSAWYGVTRYSRPSGSPLLVRRFTAAKYGGRREGSP